MRNFWKKANRGLLLGGVLLLGLVCFVMIKEVQFRVEAPQICDRARETVEAMLNLNVSGETATIGQVRTVESRTREMERAEEMLSEYWDVVEDQS